MSSKGRSLDRLLKEVCIKGGATVYGVASAAEVDRFPRIKVGWGINKYSRKPTAIMPNARSVVVFGVASSEDIHETVVRFGQDDYEYPGYLILAHIRRLVVSALKAEGYDSALPSEKNAMVSYKRILPLAGIGAFGKNSLVISPEHGPWLRFGIVITDAPLKPNRAFKRDLCGDCDKCLRACPVDALKPYIVNDERCLVAIDPGNVKDAKTAAAMKTYQPPITKRSYIMCTACQIVCPYTSSDRRDRSHMIPVGADC